MRLYDTLNRKEYRRKSLIKSIPPVDRPFVDHNSPIALELRRAELYWTDFKIKFRRGSGVTKMDFKVIWLMKQYANVEQISVVMKTRQESLPLRYKEALRKLSMIELEWIEIKIAARAIQVIPPIRTRKNLDVAKKKDGVAAHDSPDSNPERTAK